MLGRVYDRRGLALLDRLGCRTRARSRCGVLRRHEAAAGPGTGALAPFDAGAGRAFTGLDRENRDLALACIRETAGDRPVLLVTHDAADAAGSPVVTL
ncbi:MAG: hypothetical protein ACLSUM_15560 [Dysosmobacter welbionis]